MFWTCETEEEVVRSGEFEFAAERDLRSPNHETCATPREIRFSVTSHINSSDDSGDHSARSCCSFSSCFQTSEKAMAAYKTPRPMRAEMPILRETFIWRSHTMRIGYVARDRSAKADHAVATASALAL